MHQLQQQQQKVELWALVVRDPISNPVEVNIFLLLKNWAISGLLFIFVFSIQFLIYLIVNKILPMTRSNRWFLVSEVITLPTEPQPLPLHIFLFNKIALKDQKWRRKRPDTAQLWESFLYSILHKENWMGLQRTPVTKQSCFSGKIGDPILPKTIYWGVRHKVLPP